MKRKPLETRRVSDLYTNDEDKEHGAIPEDDDEEAFNPDGDYYGKEIPTDDEEEDIESEKAGRVQGRKRKYRRKEKRRK